MKIMKNKIFIISFIYLLFCNISAKCQKNDSLNNLEILNYRKYDLVFLGEVIELDTIALVSKIKVYEIFKGKIVNDFIKVKITNSHTYLPEPSGLWLIYATQITDSIISISTNSLTRSNKNPDRNMYYIIPPPPRNKKYNNDIKYDLLKLKIDALTDWNNELYKLRNGLIK